MVELVTYSEEEEKKIIENADARNAIKVAKGIRFKRRYSYLSGWEIHRREVVSQYCVAKYFGVPMDWSITVDGNRNRPHLFVERYSVIVRMPIYPDNPILKFDSIEYFPTLLAVLCSEPGPRTVAIHGCVSRRRFIKEHTISNLNHEGWHCMIMMASQLTPIAMWKKEVRQIEQLTLTL